MLIFVCCGVVLLIGLSFWIGGEIYNRRCPYFCEVIWAHVLGASLTAVAVVTLLIVGIDVAYIQHGKQLEYDDTLESYTVISDHVNKYDTLSEHEKCLTLTNIKIYNDKIREAKYYKDNLWVGCFYNDLIADLPLIEYEGIIIDG